MNPFASINAARLWAYDNNTASADALAWFKDTRGPATLCRVELSYTAVLSVTKVPV